MQEKENQRIMLTKRLLKESLIRLMQKKDIQSITVKELCEDSGINRSTFYNHYGRPSDVLADLENDLLTGIPVISVYELDGSRSPQEVLRKQTVDFLQYIQEFRKVALLLMKNSAGSSEFASRAFDLPAIKKAINDIISEKYNDADREMISSFIQGGLYSMLRQWVLSEHPRSVEDMADLLVDVMLTVLSDSSRLTK
ncbi:MAG: TetR/AcrR family transcriptional regulator [Lachnospiraceae bacterium]|nr:TetR/AcrR family transcriptional regulator [Lachnospiraceae bacterium]